MSDQVFEGAASLNIQPYEEALDLMETRTRTSAATVAGQLAQIENALKPLAALSRITATQLVANLAQVATASTTTAKAAATGAAGVSKALNSMAADSKAWKAELVANNAAAAADFSKLADLYADRAQKIKNSSNLGQVQSTGISAVSDVGNAKTRNSAALEEYKLAAQEAAKAELVLAKAIGTRDAAAIEAAGLNAKLAGQAADGARNNLRQTEAELKLKENYYNVVEKREAELLRIQEQSAAKSSAATAKANNLFGEAANRELVARASTRAKSEREVLEAHERHKTTLIKNWLAQQVSATKKASTEKIETIRSEVSKAIALYEKQAAEARRLRELAVEKAASDKFTGSAARIRGDVEGADSKDRDYARSASQAQAAANVEKQAYDRLHAAKAAHLKTEDALAREVERVRIAAANAITNKDTGYMGKVRNEMKAVAQSIKEVENQYNGLIRAGGQIRGFGTQLSFFAGGLAATGIGLKNSAEDFDFWSRRVQASVLAAGGSLRGEDLSKGVQDMAFGLAEAVGSDDLAGVAEGLYVYQSAVGKAINSVEDLKRAQTGLTSVFQAATITDDSFATTIRGLLQVMAEFQLGTEDMGRTMQILQNTTQTTQAELPDMFQAFKYVGPLAHKLGMDVEDVAATFGKLSEYGLKGSQAGRGFAVMLEGLISPTKKTDKALQQLLVDNQGLAGSWKDILQPGGQFLNLLDKTDAQGNTTAGVFRVLATALKDYKPAEQMDFLNQVFGQNNAFRNAVPLILGQVDALNGVKNAAGEGKLSIEAMADSFRDSKLQATMFGEQWDLINNSIRVQFGRELGKLKQNFIVLGTAVAEIMLPMLQSLNRVVTKFMDWGEANEATAKKLLKVVGIVALLAGALGPILIIIGTVVQGFGTLPVVLASVSKGLGLFGFSLGGLLPALVGLLNPLRAVGLLVRLLATLFGVGLAGSLAKTPEFIAAFRNAFQQLGPVLEKVRATVEAFMGFLTAVFEGDSQKAQAAFENFLQKLGPAAKAAFEMLGGVIKSVTPILLDALMQVTVALVQAAPGIAKALVYALAEAFVPGFAELDPSMRVWGWNLIASLGAGMWDAAVSLVSNIVTWIAEQISRPFRSYSPPKYGPLKDIFLWGRNLIGSFLDGATSADVSAIYTVADRIGAAMESAFGEGWATGDYIDGIKKAHELTASMLETIREGGSVGDSYFDGLRGYLGEWFDQIKNISLKYQELYGLERALSLEQKRLELLKSQREVLQTQLDLRLAGFETAVDDTGPAYYKPYEKDMVDPETAAGKARIQSMRDTLSKEDFQSWISFQKKLWVSRHKEEDAVLKVQEDAISLQVQAQEQQLKIIKEQYDTMVALYEYAVKLNGLEKDDPTKKDKAGGGGGGGPEEKIDDDADSEDLRKARERVKGVVGDDGALKDEKTLGDELGGPIPGIGGADEQRDREVARAKALDAENRRIKAEYDTRKINAKGNAEELAQIKKEEEAWNAAYQEEKARLQERKGYTEDVLDATQEIADLTEPERVNAKRAEYAAEIAASIGEQPEHIQTANELKEAGGSLDAASVESQKQLRVEERTLGDLRETNDAKRLEFEERILAAAGDEEKLRIIKEEQDAWDLAYKKALDAQEARTAAARQADQDINDAQAAEPDKARVKGGAGAGAAGSGLPGPPEAGAGMAGGVPEDIEYDMPGGASGSLPVVAPVAVALPGPAAEPAQPKVDPLTEYDAIATKDGRSVATQGGADELTGMPGTPADMAMLGSEAFFSALLGLIPGVESGSEQLNYRNDLVNSGQDLRNEDGSVKSKDDGFWEDLSEFGSTLLDWGQGLNDFLVTPTEQDTSGGGGGGWNGPASSEVGKDRGPDDAVWDRNIDRLNELGDNVNAAFLNKLNGADGPFATSDFMLGQVNGVWTKVLRDSDGSPTKVSEAALDLLNSTFYEKFTGDNSPNKTVDEALTKMGIAAYVAMTGESSPPKTIKAMVDKMGVESYKLLTGEQAPPKTFMELNQKIGASMYELITGEKAPAKTSKEFVDKMALVFKELGIEGPIPGKVEDAMTAISTSVLKKLSPTGELPKNLDEAMTLMGEDFFKKFSPTGELPKTMEEAMGIIGLAATNGFTGETGLTGITAGAINGIKTLFGGLSEGEGSPVSSATTMADRVKLTHRNALLEDGGVAATNEEAAAKVREFHKNMANGEGGIVPTTEAMVAGSLLAAKGLRDGDDSVVGKVRSTVADAVAAFQDMNSTASTVFGTNGTVAANFRAAAAAAVSASISIALAAASAAAAAARGGDDGAPGGGGDGGGHYAGLDLVQGGESQPRRVTVHGQEAILNKEDAVAFRGLKQRGLWETLKGAANSARAVAGSIRSVAEPAPKSTTATTADGSGGKSTQDNGSYSNKTVTNNFNIGAVNANNEDSARNFLRQVSLKSAL